jgi:hypothetical protein
VVEGLKERRGEQDVNLRSEMQQNIQRAELLFDARG